jgi:biopolymer transport protein ExbB/TolQ
MNRITGKVRFFLDLVWPLFGMLGGKSQQVLGRNHLQHLPINLFGREKERNMGFLEFIKEAVIREAGSEAAILETMKETDFFESIKQAFIAGGWGMYPIAILCLFIIAISAERISYLFFKARINKDDFVNSMHKFLFDGNLQRAVTYCSSSSAPLATIVKSGLLHVDGTEAEIQSAMDEKALIEMPKIEKRTGYLAMLGNVAVLAGLLGTITGLIRAFGAVAFADASEKALVLAKGISEAMNCTAFGLGTAIVGLIAFSLLSGRTQNIVDDINESSVRLLNLILANKDKLNTRGLSDAD